MRITSRFLLALAAACLSPLASAMSLGEGQILSHIGEPFSANIALLGDYDKNVKFHQVRSAECHSSIIGKNANGCDSLYEGTLVFLIKRRPDGQYFLRVNGERSDELFYRIIIKTALSTSGVVYNSFDFLPEIKPNPDAASAGSADGEVTVDNSLPSGKYGVVMGKIVDELTEDVPQEAPASPAGKPVEPVSPKAVIAGIPDEIKPATRKEPKPVSNETAALQGAETKPAAKKSAESRLQIRKYGEYSDDIYALQKENEEIEQQIVLLEKQISLLREVVRLKNQIGAPPLPETAIAPIVAIPASASSIPASASSIPASASSVPASASSVPASASSVPASASPASAPRPARVRVTAPQNESSTGLFAWALLVVVALLAALLAFLYWRQKNLQASASRFDFTPTILTALSRADVRESLDLTASFDKKKP